MNNIINNIMPRVEPMLKYHDIEKLAIYHNVDNLKNINELKTQHGDLKVFFNKLIQPNYLFISIVKAYS